MVNDMERSRDGYRGRYRDRHNNNNNGLTNRHNHEDRSTRGNYHEHSTHDNNHNGNYSSRNSSNSSYNYRSSRTSFNSRPVILRNNSSTNYHNDDHYHHHHHHPPISSSSNRRNSGNSSQSNYYENSSPSSRFDRSSNHREIYPSLLDEQPILSNAPLPTTSLYYSSSSISYPRDRNLPLPSTQYIESDRNRYMHLSNRRDSPSSSSSPASSYRNERSMDYGSRTTNNDIYMRGEYRLPSPSSLVPLSTRADPYDDIYRANDYGNRSERYDIPFNRTNISSREYSNYRNSSNVSMSSSSPSSSYISREQYPSDVAYRSTSSQSRDYENPSSRLIDNQESLSRNSRDRNHMDYHSSYYDRPNLKRSASRYNDNGPIPSKRPMRR